jgi:hypothetical protein
VILIVEECRFIEGMCNRRLVAYVQRVCEFDEPVHKALTILHA